MEDGTDGRYWHRHRLYGQNLDITETITKNQKLGSQKAFEKQEIPPMVYRNKTYCRKKNLAVPQKKD